MNNKYDKLKEKRRKKIIKNLKFFKQVRFKKNFLKIAYFIIVICIFYNFIYFLNTTITKNDYLHLFDISILTLNIDKDFKTDNTVKTSDLVIMRDIEDAKGLQISDIIAYKVKENIKINRVFNIQNDFSSGKKYITTKSDLNYHPDIEKISEKQVIGKKLVIIPKLGSFIKVIQSKWVSLFSVVFLGFKFSYNKYLFKMQRRRLRKKKKQVEEKNDYTIY